MGKPDITLDIVIATALRISVATIRRTIRSVVANTHYHKRIILVVNSKFNDEQAVALVRNATGGLDSAKMLNVIYLQGEQGYTRPNNVGMAISDGDYVCLLSDDISVPPQWDKMLIDGIVKTGAAICVPLIEGNIRGNSIGKHPDKKTGFHLVNHMVPFACVMFPASTVHRFGLMSPHPGLALLGQDEEYCLRVTEAGAAIVIAADCVIGAPRRNTLGPVIEERGLTESGAYKMAVGAMKELHPSY